jgi:hypothetical protein
VDEMGVAEKFKALTANLRTNDDELISSRCKRITKRINLDFWNCDSEIAHTRYLGSYGRGTDIRGHSDVDLAVQLPWSLYKRYDSHLFNGQSALLQAVRKSIVSTYPSTEIGGDGQVVVIKFADGMRFEAVPVFLNSDKSYTYPDSNNGGSWKITNPVPEITAISISNILYNKKTKHLARMARAWKKKNSVSIKGLLIDTFAHSFMSRWKYRDKSFFYYDFMIRDFMKYLSEMDRKQLFWRAPGSGQYVWRSGAFEYKAKQAYLTAVEAISYESTNKSLSANMKWREIFGNFFNLV